MHLKSHAKLRDFLFGRLAEFQAEAALVGAGFAVLDRNLRIGRAEIDLLACREDLLTVVEVRARGRGAWVRGIASVSLSKRRRLRRAGRQLWLARYHHSSFRCMRFDIISVRPEGLEHIEGAF